MIRTGCCLRGLLRADQLRPREGRISEMGGYKECQLFGEMMGYCIRGMGVELGEGWAEIVVGDARNVTGCYFVTIVGQTRKKM